MSRAWIIALALVSGACSGGPEVDVRTRVGPRPDPEDAVDRAGFESALLVLDAMTRGLRPPPPAPGQRVVARAPTTAAQFDQLVGQVEHAPLDDVPGPVRRLSGTPAGLWPRVQAALLRPRTAPKGDYRSLLAAIGGDVPNRYGLFKLHWKRAHGHNVKLSDDWFEDLLALPRSKISGALRKVYRDTLLQTALLRAASTIGTDPALAGVTIATLLDVAYLHGGTFRDETGRAIAAIGDEAVPHLIRQSVRPSDRERDRDTVPVRRAMYAQYQLDRMDRLHPRRAVDAVRHDPRLLAKVLAAYGDATMGEAVDVLLDHADAPTPAVRNAARESLHAYVTGPAPKAITREVRMVGGGTKITRAFLSHRQRVAQALRERLAAVSPDVVEEECDRRRADWTIDAGCETQPARHLGAYLAVLDAARQRRESAALQAALSDPDPDGAIDALDRILAVNPHPAGAGEMITAYRSAADDADPARAGQLLRKAAMLASATDPGLAADLTVQALRAEAETPRLPDHGRAMLLATAAEIAGDDGGAGPAAGAPVSRGPAAGWTRVAGGLGLTALALTLLMVATGPLRRRLLRPG